MDSRGSFTWLSFTWSALVVAVAALFGSCLARAPAVHFARTGALQAPLVDDFPVYLYPDGPPQPPFAELGVLTLRCGMANAGDQANADGRQADADAEACLRQAELQARAHGGNGLVLMPFSHTERAEGLVKFLVIQRDPRLR